jgi:hypothetical protein
MWNAEEVGFAAIELEPQQIEPVTLTAPEEAISPPVDAATASEQEETGFELAEVFPEESGFAIVQPSKQAVPANLLEHSEENGGSFSIKAVRADQLAAAFSQEAPATAPIAFDNSAAQAAQVEQIEEPEQAAPPERVEQHAQAVEPEHAAPLSVDLSPVVIDEIVRRVIAQMSDAVVREVAWEIVPDCVERVIERLAREAMTKKL